MADSKQVTVKMLAVGVKKDPQDLLQTMQEAGLDEIKSVDDIVSVSQKMKLLRYLKERNNKSTSVQSRPVPSGARSSKVGGVDVQVKTSRQVKNFLEAADPEPIKETDVVLEKEVDPVAVEDKETRVNACKEDQSKAAVTVLDDSSRDPHNKSLPKKATEASRNLDSDSESDGAHKKRKASVRKQRLKDKTRRQVEEALSLMTADDEIDDLNDSHTKPIKRSIKKVSHASSSKLIKQEFSKPTQVSIKEVSIADTITPAELAAKMSVKSSLVIKTMMGMGVMATINQSIDQETALLVVEEMGHTAKIVSQTAVEEALITDLEESLGNVLPCPPVVTIMGHVDHGKTSLLDMIRRSKVTGSEAGGITQHIGAYHVTTDKGVICFLDTPGHAAFAAMRARGAKCTDIVILVVAADDGVMPQTIEAIQHAKAAGVPLIVAVNKIDKPEADVERILSELAQHDVISEAWGGDTIFQQISAKTGQGIDDLLDSILLQAEVLELTAPVDGLAKGDVIESRLDKGRGPVATILVSSGTLRQGDIILAGREYGRVRAMIGDNGKKCKVAGPAVPVEILGLSAAPEAGDEAWVVPDERRAREAAVMRQKRFRQARIARQKSANLENLFANIESDKQAVLNIILKADVQGSAEAISEALLKLSNDEVKVNLVSVGVGGLNESDINLAIASHAVVLGFNVRASSLARDLAKKEGVDLRYYSIIYNLMDEVKSALSGMLAPEIKENIVGLAQVRDIFRSSKLGAVAGCMVVEGRVKRHSLIRVLRDDIVVFEGELESLRRFKDDLNEVSSGKECGIGVKNYNDIKVGDMIEAFERVEVKREL